MYDNALNTYRQTNYFTANPIKLILMCYEEAIGSLKLARDSYVAKEYEAKGKALQKSIDIIHELNASLDVQKGGEVALNLRALYMYMTQALTEADIKKDLPVFDHVIRMLEELESAWQEISCGLSGNVSPALRGVPEVAENSVVVGRAWSA